MGLRWRLILASLVFLVSLVYALPSVPVIGPALERVLPSSKINLGLDLKGGIHLTLGVDVAKAVSNSLALAGQDLRRMAQDEKIIVLRPRVVGGTTLEFILPRAENESKLREILARHFPQLSVAQPLAGEGGQLRYVAHFTPAEVKRLEDMALDQALRTIRNRIDQFGVAEPDIRKQAWGEDAAGFRCSCPAFPIRAALCRLSARRPIWNFIWSGRMWTPARLCCLPGLSFCPCLRKIPGSRRPKAVLRLKRTPCSPAKMWLMPVLPLTT